MGVCMMISARMEDNIEGIKEAIEMNTKAIAHLNQNFSKIAFELRDMKVEIQAIRRNTVALNNLKKE